MVIPCLFWGKQGVLSIRKLNCFNIKKGYYINEDGLIYSSLVNQYRQNEALRQLKTYKDKDGYLGILLVCKDGKRRHFRISRLVAQTYIENPSNHPIVLHKDNNKENNHYSNLRWGTIAENTQQAYDDGLCSNTREIEVYNLNGERIHEFISASELCRHFGYKVGSVTTMLRRCDGTLPNPPPRGKMKNYILKHKA